MGTLQRPRGAALRLLVYLLCLAMLSPGGIAFAAGPAKGVVTSVVGKAALVRAGQKPVSLRVGDAVLQGDVLRTDEKSLLEVRFPDNSKIVLKDKAQVEVAEYYQPPTGGWTSLFKLAMGKLRTLVAKVADRRFAVNTPTAVVGIRGTDGLTWAVSEKLTRVSVHENVMTVSNVLPSVPGTVEVGAGFTTEVAAGMAPVTPFATPAGLLQELNATQPTGPNQVRLPDGRTVEITPDQVNALKNAQGVTYTTESPVVGANQMAISLPAEMGGGYIVGTPEALAAAFNAAGITIGATAAMLAPLAGPLGAIVGVAAVLGVVVGATSANDSTTSHSTTSSHH
jgi:hypothetical protein